MNILCSREERRWLERQNKAERQRKRREEIQRLRDLVGKVIGFGLRSSHMCFPSDNAYKCDPRVEKFLIQEQEEKAAKRRAKEEAARKKEQVKDFYILYNVIV